MRVGIALAGVCAMVVSAYLVVALVSPRPPSVGPVYPGVAPAAVAEGAPPIALDGPQPKAVIDQTDYDFGRMEVGDEQKHAFTIKNEGQAPLKIVRGKTTCQCTVSEVESGEVAVGASAKITLTWKPVVQAEQFGKGADILTNDPDNPVIKLKILGMVVPGLVTVPSKNWEATEIALDKPTVFTGLVVSPVHKEFQVVDLECKSPYVTVESLPIEPEQLTMHNGISGFQIRVSISPEIPIGAFNIPLVIKTDVAGRPTEGKPGKPIELEVSVTGQRRGPIRIISREWDELQMAISMGAFDAAAGKKLTLMAFVRGAPAEGLQLTEPPICDPKALQVTLVPDEKATGKLSRYLLTVEYPPGAPRATYLKDQPASVHLRTNHPAASEIDLHVHFSAN